MKGRPAVSIDRTLLERLEMSRFRSVQEGVDRNRGTLPSRRDQKKVAHCRRHLLQYSGRFVPATLYSEEHPGF